jgi:hypothetical protein
MKIISGYIDVPVMSYNSIKGWMLLYGYHLLTKEKEKRKDNVFINDFSIQLGQQKCLLVLRCSLEKMRVNGFNLSHGQAEIVELQVVKKSDNKLVTASLESASLKTGKPKQIVSDGGSDIKKGNEIFCIQNPGTVYTYDVGHKTACLLKALLEKNDSWKSLLENINKTLMCVQQTELSFLRPILPRKKSRYLNISILIYWVQNILRFKDRKVFSLIDSKPGYVYNPECLSKVCAKFSHDFSSPEISKLAGEVFQKKQEAIEALSLATGSDLNEKDIEIISLANKRFCEKFGIFEQYRNLVNDLSMLVSVINDIQFNIKHHGLSIYTMDLIEQSVQDKLLTGEKTKQIYYQLINFLNEEISKFGNDTSPYLGSSDIIESIFGKYKYKLTDRLGSMNSSILFLPVICSDLNSNDLLHATNHKLKDVQSWYNDLHGVESMQLKRREAFSI